MLRNEINEALEAGRPELLRTIKKVAPIFQASLEKLIEAQAKFREKFLSMWKLNSIEGKRNETDN